MRVDSGFGSAQRATPRRVPRTRRPLPSSLLRLIDDQVGVVSRRQLLACGLPESLARDQVLCGRWRRVFPGIWLTFTGPIPARARVWAAVLACGDGAVAAGPTALALAGATDREPDGVIHVSVPHRRRVRGPSGVRVSRRRDLDRVSLSAASPPRVRLEPAVLDVADAQARASSVIGLVMSVIQSRRTTAQRLRDELATRSRHRWRGLLSDLLGDVEAGIQSPLECRYVTGVARAHGLPAARHNHRDLDDRGRARYRDADYVGQGVVVELDGRSAHPATQAFRDRARDNAVAAAGGVPLRYGWPEVVGDPCGVAAEVAAVLQARGWRGAPHPCGPACRVGAEKASGTGEHSGA